VRFAKRVSGPAVTKLDTGAKIDKFALDNDVAFVLCDPPAAGAVDHTAAFTGIAKDLQVWWSVGYWTSPHTYSHTHTHTHTCTSTHPCVVTPCPARLALQDKFAFGEGKAVACQALTCGVPPFVAKVEPGELAQCYSLDEASFSVEEFTKVGGWVWGTVRSCMKRL
jgi:hypothetical protein